MCISPREPIWQETSGWENSHISGSERASSGGVQIGQGVIIGAGAAVIDDIPDNVTAVGVPAKVIRGNR